VDTRDTAEEAELRRSARQLARDLGPATVADLSDVTRATRLAAAVAAAGWLELRHDGGDGAPLAGGPAVAIVADALGEAVSDTAFAGPVLAADLARRAGTSAPGIPVVAFSPDLCEPGVVDGADTATTLYAVDTPADTADAAYMLVPDDGGFHLGSVPIGGAASGTDLTRGVSPIPAGTPVSTLPGKQRLTDDDLASWSALGLAVTSADLVGVMRGVLDVTVAYAKERQQYGVAVGSFQAVQHLLAEASCLLEGSHSVALHAAWAVDNLAPHDALTAGRVAKAYCARAASTVCETAIQVHGGIGNTWECMVHVFLRRALLSSQWFGDDAEQLRQLGRARLGVTSGLS
jgi:hypothetical protein